MSLNWLAVVGAIYAAALICATWFARARTHSTEDFMLGGSNVGAALGCLTFGATLFSTFTLMGMPDFFRTHGVGAWIFLGVADAAVAFVVLWFAVHIRRAARRFGFAGVAGLMAAAYRTRWAGWLCFAGVFLFLIPYVAVQIRGISILLSAAYPDTLPTWGWALGIVLALLVYSEIGGLKAIIYSDALQGLVLLGATWIIAWTCAQRFGSFVELVRAAENVEPALMSLPGPEGLFGMQFMLASLAAILVLPITQPQLATRLVIMSDLAASRRMAVSLGVFSMLVILPTLAIGLYGAVTQSQATTADFLATVLLREPAPALAATVAVGLIAAAMSTADSQLFALGGELRSMLRGDPGRVMLQTRVAMGFFAAAALGFAVISADELVLLARVSFAGTALLAPLIICGVMSKAPRQAVLLPATAMALLTFLGSVLGLVPAVVAGLRLDLLLFVLLAAIAAVGALRLR